MSESNKATVPGARASEPGTRLDSTVITRPTGEEGQLFYENGQVIEVTNLRIVKTGDRVEVYEYEKPVRLHAKHKTKKLKNKKSPRDQEYRSRRAHRSNNNIRRLANGNFVKRATFLTLTFNNDQDFDINNIDECNDRLKAFVKRLKQLFPDLKYIAVLEFQQRGAVHYHLLNDLPFIEKEVLAELWGHGFIDIREITDPEKVGGYIAKYMAKNSVDPRFSEHRSYFTSRNLIRPEIFYGFKAEPFLKQLKENQAKPVFENEYFCPYQGKAKYQDYNLAKPEEDSE